MEAIEKSLKIEPTNDLAYLYRGNLYMVSKEFDKAMADYEVALKLNPRNEIARAALTRLRQAPPAQ
jgi:Tfp pilus assembly protein PilF